MSIYGVSDSRVFAGEEFGPGAKQAMREECDVNLIMAQFVKTGFIDHLAKGVPSFVDVSECPDYRTALEHVRSVEEYFNDLPADVRDRFRNDTVEFMEYLDSGASEEDLKALGLEVLGDRRARARNGRKGDVEPDPEPKAKVEVKPKAVDDDGLQPEA